MSTRSASPTASVARVRTVSAALFSGDETLEVVGESHYQEALWDVVGGRQPQRVRFETYAALIPNPRNPYDSNAIEVQIEGRLVGHLSREDAARYRPGLIELMKAHSGQVIALHAVIVGGGQRSDGPGYLGVFLDHDPADFGLRPDHISHRHLRTGVSEAMATEVADDNRQLSWYSQLADDDAAAIQQLHALLDATTDPFDRHYMFSELEHRLYHCRNTIPSALDEFDVACEQHHGEIDAIRAALLEKFGGVPVIELYRQAAIRCAKERRWSEVQQWAERGLGVYGNDAIRPEVVTDLHERIARANAKIEAGDRPKQHRATAVTTARSDGLADVETLTCAKCGAAFERVRSRGRKPQLCPACREPHPTATAEMRPRTSA